MNGKILAIIGNGMACNRVLEELGEHHPYQRILIMGDESIPHYNRIMLSPLLAEETTLPAITPHEPSWYQQRRTEVLLNQTVNNLDIRERQLTTDKGVVIQFDDLIFATGSRSFIPPVPGADHPDVIGFRTMSDVDRMLEKMPGLKQAVVIGAGLLGVEAAVGLRHHGIDVTLLHRNPVLMNRQLDATASGILERELTNRGIHVMTGVSPEEILSDSDAISAVRVLTRDGVQSLPAQLVIFATGITPNAELAKEAGITTGRGIAVNSQMQTSEAGIYALGECCEFDGNTYGLVAPIWDQAKVLAKQLMSPSESDLHYLERTHLTKLKVSGLDVHSIGEFNAPDDSCDVLTLEDLTMGVYKKLILKNDRIIGVLCVGDVSDSHWFYDLMVSDIDVTPFRENLIFGEWYCEEFERDTA